ncbi:MAG TPA: OB-fold domain-containing protein [Acidimicrobiales bacterium]|nr:OB-fold domain-containing protein [Acidimicrobiales bacterium]
MTGTFLPTTEWLVHDWYRACIDTGALCIQRCASCGTWRHPPRRFCARCASDDARFEPVSGTGTIFSLAVSHRSLDPSWQELVPFPTLVVELDEGPRVLTATHAAPADVAIGDRVTVSVEPRSDDFAMLWGELSGDDARRASAPPA